jgi:hypothetical protein
MPRFVALWTGAHAVNPMAYETEVPYLDQLASASHLQIGAKRAFGPA